MTLAACSLSTTSSTAAKSASSASSQAGANSVSSFCRYLVNSQSETSQLTTTMTQAIASANVTTAKQALDSLLSTIDQDLAMAESKIGAVAADIQAAITTVNNFFAEAKTAIANATSLSQMGTAMAGLDTQQLEDAGETLTAYANSQCGTATSTTT
ncbi:MAG TPA: hypothetical protein VED63_01710 [Acidimicrobiales bacterium]|nr:hypothetical protein [Acidimicrobiales bacterium]